MYSFQIEYAMCLPDQDTGQYKYNHFAEMEPIVGASTLVPVWSERDYQYAIVYLLGALLVKFVRNNTVTDKNKVLGEPLACSLELDDTCM